MSSFARLAQFAEQAKWPCPREEMTEPGAIVLRMIDDLEALAMRDAPMTVGALVAMGWPQEAARRFFPCAYESAAINQSIAGLLRPEAQRVLTPEREMRVVAPPPANDDAPTFAMLQAPSRELRAFLLGAGCALFSALLIGVAVQAAWKGLP